MIGARELWIRVVYRYRLRGRVDSERERESFIRKYEKENWVHRERERERELYQNK